LDINKFNLWLMYFCKVVYLESFVVLMIIDVLRICNVAQIIIFLSCSAFILLQQLFRVVFLVNSLLVDMENSAFNSNIDYFY
jgi:hypothetical protein